MNNPTATIIDYGVGNMMSVTSAVDVVGGTPIMSSDEKVIAKADRLILPGVGAFKDAMDDMHASGLVEQVQEFAKSGRPILGICLGAQMLLSTSEEFGLHQGLDLIKGAVVKIPETDTDENLQRIPHVGWQSLDTANSWDSTVLNGLEPGVDVYFVHSLHPVPNDPKDVYGTCQYGGHTINGAIGHDNVWGCQFHPEKSASTGLTILHNFLRM